MGWQVVYVPFLFAGDTIIETKGIFVYSSTPTLGNLIASIAPQAGVDDFGNVFQQGTTSYLTLSGKTYAVGLNTLSGTGLPGLSIEDIVSLPTSPAGFFGEASSNVSTPQAFAAITSGQANATDVASFISVLSQLQAGPTGGQIVLQAGDTQFDINGDLFDWVTTASGELVYDSNVDGNSYNVGTITRHATALPQTINSASNQLVTGLSANIYPGLYEMEVNLQYHGNQAAGTPQFQIAQDSGTIINRWGNGIIWDTNNGVNRFTANTTNMIYAGPTISVNEWVVFLKGFFQCTVAGGIDLFALTSVAADTYVIDNAMFTLRRRS